MPFRFIVLPNQQTHKIEVHFTKNKHFVIKTNGMRKRRFDRSTVIIKQSEDKNFHKY